MKPPFLMVLAFMTMLVCSASSCDKNDDNSNTENTTTLAKLASALGSENIIITLRVE